MFGVLTLERDPLKLSDVFDFSSFGDMLSSGLFTWIQVAGAVCAIALLVWLPFYLLRSAAPTERPWLPVVFHSFLGAAALSYLGLTFVRRDDVLAFFSGEGSAPTPGTVLWGKFFLTLGGLCALSAVCLPFLVNCVDLRWRRIWAVARLSFKEAIRRKILYVFCGLILVLLFMNWFVPTKPENQLQSYVEIVYRTMTPLLLVSAALLASFAIPTDIKQQTIHTVTTKPVERFEIVLGRVLGYVLLITLLLFIMTTLSLFYLLRGINPAAAEESLKARVPVYGTLGFQKVDGEYDERESVEPVKGDNVGREWDYRKYISGDAEDKPRQAVMYAVWSFRELPADLADRQFVRCEFNFDIYRTTKGQENVGVLCSFFFEARGWEKGPKGRENREKYLKERREKGGGTDLMPDVDNELSERYGYFELQGKRIADFHTLYVDVPVGLFRHARKAAEQGRSGVPALQVRVRCGSLGQLVGMARYDLYFRGDDPVAGRDTFAFILNFYKGALGLWMVLVMIIAVCVAVSSELGGFITFLCVILLYLGGSFRDFIKEISQPQEAGSMELAIRLFTRKQLAAPMEETTLTKVAASSDDVIRFVMKGILQVVPDTERYSFTDRVANGFNVAVVQQDLLPTFLMLLGYLFPWALLSFYLIRSREIAGAH